MTRLLGRGVGRDNGGEIDGACGAAVVVFGVALGSWALVRWGSRGGDAAGSWASEAM